jgi:hypothetical protein
MQADEIAGFKIKIEGKIIDFDFLILLLHRKQNYPSKKKKVLNQVQFRQLILNQWSMEF